MAWIQSDQQLRYHKKLGALMAEMGWGRREAVGALHLFWWWVLAYAPNGDISAITGEEIESSVEWKGEVGKFYNGLVKAGFVDVKDGVVLVHDWDDYSGQLERSRMSNRQRQKNFRDRRRGSASGNGSELPGVSSRDLSVGGERHFSETPLWNEFFEACKMSGLSDEKFCRDKFLAMEQKHWEGCSNWRAYVGRIKAWHAENLAKRGTSSGVGDSTTHQTAESAIEGQRRLDEHHEKQILQGKIEADRIRMSKGLKPKHPELLDTRG